MDEKICDCPYSVGLGSCDLLSDPVGNRKYPPPPGCPKTFRLKTKSAIRERSSSFDLP